MGIDFLEFMPPGCRGADGEAAGETGSGRNAGHEGVLVHGGEESAEGIAGNSTGQGVTAAPTLDHFSHPGGQQAGAGIDFKEAGSAFPEFMKSIPVHPDGAAIEDGRWSWPLLVRGQGGTGDRFEEGWSGAGTG